MKNSAEVKSLLQVFQAKDQQIKNDEIRIRQAQQQNIAGQEAIRNKAVEKKWRNTGVLSLFEELRDESVVTICSGTFPANIEMTENNCTLDFTVLTDNSSFNNENHYDEIVHKIKAESKNGQMYINGNKVEEGLVKTVATAIARERGYRG